jgi:hypothetical protein
MRRRSAIDAVGVSFGVSKSSWIFTVHLCWRLGRVRHPHPLKHSRVVRRDVAMALAVNMVASSKPASAVCAG